MDILALATALTVMAAIVVGLLALHRSTASPRSDLDRRLGSILAETSELEPSMAEHEALRPGRTGYTPIIRSLLEGHAWTANMASRLERADIKLTVTEFVALRIFVGLMLTLAPLLLLGTTPVGLAVIALALAAGSLLPIYYVGFAQARRLNMLNEQLAEALTMLANSLKSGFGLMQSMDMVARELDHPISTEFRRTLYDINVGSSTEDALKSLAARNGSDDLDIVITAMLIQQGTGGNLAEILENVSHTLRERVRIRGEIKTMTSQQILTGWVIGGLPVAMIGLFSLINPSYIAILFEETVGNVMLVMAGMLELFGILLIKRILAIEV